MKKFGCALSLLGILVMVMSIIFFWVAAKRALQAEVVTRVPMKVGETVTTGPVSLNPEQLGRVGIDLTLTTDKVEEEKSPATDKVKYVPKYHFPVTYKVMSVAGDEIVSQEETVSSSDNMRLSLNQQVTPDKATLTARRSFEKFEIPESGEVKVEATVQSDTQYGATAQTIELKVYENVGRPGTDVQMGLLVLFGGAFLLVLGLIMFFLGVVTGKKAPPSQV